MLRRLELDHGNYCNAAGPLFHNTQLYVLCTRTSIIIVHGRERLCGRGNIKFSSRFCGRDLLVDSAEWWVIGDEYVFRLVVCFIEFYLFFGKYLSVILESIIFYVLQVTSSISNQGCCFTTPFLWVELGHGNHCNVACRLLRNSTQLPTFYAPETQYVLHERAQSGTKGKTFAGRYLSCCIQHNFLDSVEWWVSSDKSLHRLVFWSWDSFSGIIYPSLCFSFVLCSTSRFFLL